MRVAARCGQNVLGICFLCGLLMLVIGFFVTINYIFFPFQCSLEVIGFNSCSFLWAVELVLLCLRRFCPRISS